MRVEWKAGQSVGNMSGQDKEITVLMAWTGIVKQSEVDLANEPALHRGLAIDACRPSGVEATAAACKPFSRQW